MINTEKLLFIYNPRAGKGTLSSAVPEIIRVFGENGYLPTVYRTQCAEDGPEAAKELGCDFDLVVCAGGDGTLNNVISGIMEIPEDKRPRVGFIPAGSTNDTRCSYGLPNDFTKAAEIAVKGTPFKTDIGKCNDNYFTYVASLGELSAVACFTSQVAKSIFGRSAYITEGIKALMEMKSNRIKVTYDGGELEGNFFLGMVTNALSVGGFQGITGENVDLADGLFEVMLLKKPADLVEFNKEVEAVLLAGKKNNQPDTDLVIKFKTSKAVFESEDEVQWVVDGENAGKHKVTEITNMHRAIEIMSAK